MIAAFLAATLVGVLTAVRVPIGVGVAIALFYVPLVLINLPLGLALWVGLVLFQHLPFVSVGPNFAAILIALAWLGTLSVRRAHVRQVLSRHRRTVLSLALVLIWLTISLAWAEDPGAVAGEMWIYYVAAAIFVIVATTPTKPQHVRLIVVGFVVGAVISVLIGLLSNGLDSSASAIETATEIDGRLKGGAGDPNYLAAGLIPAVLLAGSLFSFTRDPLIRLSLGIGIAIMTVGFVATQSRAGLLAAAAAGLAALFVYRRARRYVVLFIALILSVGGLWFASYPGAWERITSYDDGGAGRSDLWEIAWRITQDHPVVGVGLDNFRTHSGDYVREPGALTYVDLIAERPRIVHNLYLQLLTENGVIGLVLFLIVIAAMLAVLWRAIGRLDAQGDVALGAVARATLVGLIGMLAAGFFISYAPDPRLWILFGLGPALLAIAESREGRRDPGRPGERPPGRTVSSPRHGFQTGT